MALSNVTTYTASRKQFVLVVNSHDSDLFYTSALLERFQYSVWTARTGGEALEIAAVATPILVIASEHLEDMPGIELITKLKQIDSTRTVSIIVLTRKTDPANERACLSAGAVVCLPAPFLIEDLYRLVQMTIEPVPRMHLRIKTKLPVFINNRAVDCDEGGCARALSELGAYVKISRPYPLKTRLPIQIHLDDTALSLEAEVIYTDNNVNDQQKQPGMGLQFVQISRQDQVHIRKFIQDEITRGIR